MVLSEAQVMLWLGHFLWPFLRITGLLLTAPVYGSPLIPGMVKAALAAAMAAAMALWLPGLPPFPGDPLSAIYTGLIQIAFGAMLGMVMQIVVSAVAGAGEIAGLAMGLSFAELQFRESPGMTPVLYDIMLWAGMLGYMAAGGPLWLFAALAHSFQHGVGVGGSGSWSALAALGGTLLSSAVVLAMPVLAVSLCVNLTVGLTSVFAPQMNLLTIGFPLLILAGLWVFSGAVLYLGHDMEQLLRVGTGVLNGMLGRHG
ncbi:flagellar biosynthetic protein FliR [Acidocella sp.]|uniref:flagellar biosynthetic protein FliR n=1 Tax=Acidocella sp. TaxID=50710 RepID=UPI0025BADF5A|nr:flagellar biosynthetic protein FliR [Acidocella sp.]